MVRAQAGIHVDIKHMFGGFINVDQCVVYASFMTHFPFQGKYSERKDNTNVYTNKSNTLNTVQTEVQ